MSKEFYFQVKKIETHLFLKKNCMMLGLKNSEGNASFCSHSPQTLYLDQQSTCVSVCRGRFEVNEKVIFYLPVLTEVRTLQSNITKRCINLIYYPGLTRAEEQKDFKHQLRQILL